MKNDLPKYKQLIAFIDLVFNVMMAFAFLFILAFALMNVESRKHKPAPEMKAEAMIVLSYPDWAPCDLDLWLQLPDGKAVWWQNKNVDHATLERDDLGLLNDFTRDPVTGAMVINPINREVIMIRKLVPGTYQVNAHYWLRRSVPAGAAEEAARQGKTIPEPPYKVRVELYRLNPVYQEVVKVDLILEGPGSEKSAFGFTITPDGKIINIDRVERKFVTSGTGGVGGYDTGVHYGQGAPRPAPAPTETVP